MILAIVVMNGAFGALQEGRAQAAAQAVRTLLEPHATVVRDGRARRMQAAALVPGDLMVMAWAIALPRTAACWRPRRSRSTNRC